MTNLPALCGWINLPNLIAFHPIVKALQPEQKLLADQARKLIQKPTDTHQNHSDTTEGMSEIVSHADILYCLGGSNPDTKRSTLGSGGGGRKNPKTDSCKNCNFLQPFTHTSCAIFPCSQNKRLAREVLRERWLMIYCLWKCRIQLLFFMTEDKQNKQNKYKIAI